MDIVFIVQRKQRVKAAIQAKRPGQPVDPLPLPTYCYKVIDTRTGDYVGEYDQEDDAQNLCNRLNVQLPQNQPR